MFWRRNRTVSREQAASMDLATRVRLEKELTDAEKATFKPHPIPADWTFDRYRLHSLYRARLFGFLGSLEGKVILDLGCGYHPTPVYFALAGARMVYACDVSPNAVTYIDKLAAQNHVSDRVRCFVCAGEYLPLPDESVELIHGEAVLHHMQLPLASREIARVLKPGGKAGFKDPLGHNLLLEFARDHLSYRWKKAAKGTDRPLRIPDIEQFCQNFSRSDYEGFGFFSLPAVYLCENRNALPRRLADHADAYALPRLRRLQRYCRFVVTCVQK